tara:strand:- start:15733 stop:16692 length:960 start_codon:yes stop_codon:yes gene_type:complete
MALDLTGLTAYIDEQNFPMVTKALIGGRTASMLTPQMGVAGKTKINLLDVDVNMQDGSGCAWNASGNVDLTQREIDAKQVKINLELCPKDLQGFYWRTQMAAGTHQDSIPFEEQFSNYLVEKVQDEIEKVIWNGDAQTPAAGNLGMFDGLVMPRALYTDCNLGTGSFPTPLTTAVTISNVLEAIERIYVETPSAAVAQGDFKIFMGTDKFRVLAAALMNGNGLSSAGGQLNNYTSDFDPLRLIFPGTNIEVVGVGGLDGFNDIYGMSMANAFLGVNLSEDSSKIESWYSQDDRVFRVAMEFTMGVQVAVPANVGKVIVA